MTFITDHLSPLCLAPLLLGSLGLGLGLPQALSAQEISGAASLGYGKLTGPADFEEAGIRALDGQMTLAYDNGLMLGARAASARADFEGIDEDASINVFGLTAGAGFANFWNGGFYYEFGDLSIDGFGNESIDSHGVFLGYDSDLMAFELFAGKTDGYALAGTDLDWTDLGARAAVNIGATGRIGGHVQRSRLSESGESANLLSYGLGGHYGFAQGFSAFAGLTRAEVEDVVGEMTTFGIGMGYDLSTAANFPATLSLELARTRLDDGTDRADLDTIRFGVTLPLGAARSLPLNSVAASALNPNRTALSTALVGAF
jgi:hypothetical protein